MPQEGKRERVVQPFRLLMHVSDNSRLTVLQAQSRSGYIAPPSTGPARLLKPASQVPVVPPLRLPPTASPPGRHEETKKALGTHVIQSTAAPIAYLDATAPGHKHVPTPHPAAGTGFWRGLLQSTLGAVTPATWGYSASPQGRSGGMTEGSSEKAHAQGCTVDDAEDGLDTPTAGRLTVHARVVRRGYTTDDETSSSGTCDVTECASPSIRLLTPAHSQPPRGRGSRTVIQHRETSECEDGSML